MKAARGEDLKGDVDLTDVATSLQVQTIIFFLFNSYLITANEVLHINKSKGVNA